MPERPDYCPSLFLADGRFVGPSAGVANIHEEPEGHPKGERMRINRWKKWGIMHEFQPTDVVSFDVDLETPPIVGTIRFVTTTVRIGTAGRTEFLRDGEVIDIL